MIATPPPTPVTVPLLSTLATATLLDDQAMRTVGMTLPTRSNAVASSPLRSPTFIVTDGGATCTSATFCARSAPGKAATARRRTLRAIIVAPNVSARKCRCQANLSRNGRNDSRPPSGVQVHLRGSIRKVSYRPRPPTNSEERPSDARVNRFFGEQLDGLRHDGADVSAGTAHASRSCTHEDRKSTRLNSSHVSISYAVFCL